MAHWPLVLFYFGQRIKTFKFIFLINAQRSKSYTCTLDTFLIYFFFPQIRSCEKCQRSDPLRPPQRPELHTIQVSYEQVFHYSLFLLTSKATPLD